MIEHGHYQESIFTIDDLFHQFSGVRILSKVDFMSRYQQLNMKESDISKTAFQI